MVVRAGFEPANSKRTDLQSACFSHLHISPRGKLGTVGLFCACQVIFSNFCRAFIKEFCNTRYRCRETPRQLLFFTVLDMPKERFSLNNLPNWMRGRFDDSQRFLRLYRRATEHRHTARYRSSANCNRRKDRSPERRNCLGRAKLHI